MKSAVKIFLAVCTAFMMLFVAGCNGTGQKGPASNSGTSVKPEPQDSRDASSKSNTDAKGAEIETRLYFPNENGDGLKYVKVKVPEKDKYKAAVEILVSGTHEPGLADIFPKGTKVRSVKVKDGIATADFSRELKDAAVGGSTGERMLVSALVNTLTEFPDVKRVLITVEGKRIRTISGHLELDEPIARPAGLIK